MNPVEAMVKHQVLFCKHYRKELDAILDAHAKLQNEGVEHYKHETYLYGQLPCALLYRLDHPHNELKGQAWLKDCALRAAGVWLKGADAPPAEREAFMEQFAEWPSFILGQIVDLLGEDAGPGVREKAHAMVAAWIAHASKKPFGKTSPNHESWRCGSMYRCGVIFDEPAWCERALFLFKQLCKLQTPEGFFEEGRHHGPSMKYNCLMLSPLAWVGRMSGEPWLLDAARRLAQFMATWVFPDGNTVGTFDGRQSTSPAYWAPVCPGLELNGEGVTLNERGAGLWKQRRMLDEERALGPSNWYTHFGVFFTADSLRYYGEFLKNKPQPKAAPLAVDKPAARLENHSATFDGLLRRDGPWVLAVSGQNSDVPKDGGGRFRLERQSRIELWHEKGGVVLGGGHNREGWAVPFANAALQTGYEGRIDFGEAQPAGDKGTKVLYMPRLAASRLENDGVRLTLDFAHGTVEFALKPEGGAKYRIDASWNICAIERLALQIPLVVWRGGALSAGGKALAFDRPGLSEPVQACTVEDKIAGARFAYTLPDVGVTRLRLGLEPLRSYGNPFEKENFDTPYHIVLASTQLDTPPKTGKAAWTITAG